MNRGVRIIGPDGTAWSHERFEQAYQAHATAKAEAIQRIKILFAEVAELTSLFDLAGMGDGEGGWLFNEMRTALGGQLPRHAPSTSRRKKADPCEWCGSKDELNWDHIVPRSRRGSNHAHNRRWLCGPCNRFKGNLLDEEISAEAMTAHLESRRQVVEVSQ